jgi:hypothetical protein
MHVGQVELHLLTIMAERNIGAYISIIKFILWG